MASYFSFLTTPVGKICITSDGKNITRIDIDKTVLFPEGTEDFIIGDSVGQNAVSQLKKYFYGSLKKFDLPVCYEVSGFSRKVLEATANIPYGSLASYGEIAESIGNPKAVRAVGNALNKNPLPIIIPCHRVVGANRTSGGYAYGMQMKQQLISLEQKYLGQESENA